MIEDGIQYDVNVSKAFKRYGTNNVLNGLEMKVQSCTIYGLLGASGCGKSTLLQCILGTMALDSGSIYLKAENIKDVGYMPQNLCLEETLSVRETFEYFGTLYNMSKKHIENRIYEINTFLLLPNLKSYISELSGGQSRKVSLAVSLLHDPKIIILDEPTVGIDPLLKYKVWAEFTKMVREHQKTIIITTHCIEEAKEANHVGLIRNGKIIEEGSPQYILVKYGTDTLEEAFLTLCYNQENNKILHNGIQPSSKTNTTRPIKLKLLGNNINLYRITALIKKYIHVCSRDYLLLFTVILLPIFQSLNFCFAIGVNFKDMSIAIKNDETNFLDCQYSNVNGCIFDQSSNQTMSCVVMNYLASHNYSLTEVVDREDGEKRMSNSMYMAFIHFPKNYTKSLAEYIDNRENFDFNSTTYIHLTKENFLFRSQIMTDVFNSIKYQFKTILDGCSNNPKTMSLPLNFDILYGNEVKTYSNSMVNLFIAMLAFYFISVFSSNIMMSEKMNGVLSRSMFAGVKILELLISLFYVSTVILLIQILFTCFISFVLFYNPIQITTGLFVYMMIVLLLGWIGFLLGIITAVISPSKLVGIYIVTGIFLSQFILSGAIWPLEGQPYLLRRLSEMLPIRLVGKMMTDIAIKGWTLNHPLVIFGITMTFMYIIFLVFVLIVLGKFKKSWWVL